MTKVHSNNLNRLLAHGEDHTLDYKSADLLIPAGEDEKRKIARQLVGFANREGGKLVFGIDDDTRMPEGMEIKKEPAEGTISEVAKDWCSPPIDFKSEEFYSSKNDDLTEGSVLVIQVNSSDDIPSAVVENSGGEVKKREYRLRTGDETRLVSDEELRQLFTGQVDPDFRSDIWTWYFFTEEDPSPDGRPHHDRGPFQKSRLQLAVPQSQVLLSEYVYEYIANPETAGSQAQTKDFVPLVFINYLSELFERTWRLVWDERRHRHKRWNLDDRHQADKTEVTVSRDDIVIGNSIVLSSNWDWFQAFERRGNTVTVPNGTRIQIMFDRAFPVILFNNDAFEIEIEIRGRSQTRPLPDDHPYNRVQDAKRTLLEDGEYDEWRVHQHKFEINAKFGFPDERDSKIDQHSQFARQIEKILHHYWSVEATLDRADDGLLQQINLKLDCLLHDNTDRYSI